MARNSDVMTRRAIATDMSEAKDLPHAATGYLPLVSIIIPYFNHPAYLTATVASAKRQTYPHLEIIVVDDGSTIPADSILGEPTDIVLIRTVNGGVSAARNIGFEKSSGEYLIFLDADDLLMPGAVEAHLKALSSNPEAGMSFGPARIIDGSGEEIAPPKICRPRKEYFPMLLESNPIACPGSTMMCKGAFIEAGFFDTSFRNAEDYHLYLRIARLRPIVQHNTCVVEYRKHSGGKSNNTDRMVAAVMGILDRFEGDETLSRSERKTLERGRKRWLHAMLPKATVGYRVMGLYYRFRAMLTVPIRSYFLRRR
jgi:glycosyltransferase involved in cell wall biosynthesis